MSIRSSLTNKAYGLIEFAIVLCNAMKRHSWRTKIVVIFIRISSSSSLVRVFVVSFVIIDRSTEAQRI